MNTLFLLVTLYVVLAAISTTRCLFLGQPTKLATIVGLSWPIQLLGMIVASVVTWTLLKGRDRGLFTLKGIERIETTCLRAMESASQAARGPTQFVSKNAWSESNLDAIIALCEDAIPASFCGIRCRGTKNIGPGFTIVWIDCDYNAEIANRCAGLEWGFHIGQEVAFLRGVEVCGGPCFPPAEEPMQ